MIVRRLLSVAAVVTGVAVLSGCAALSAEWEAKSGASDDAERRAAERDAAWAEALPDAEFSLRGNKSGFAQEVTLTIVLPDADAVAAVDAAAVEKVVDAYCATDPRADFVRMTIQSDSELRDRVYAPLEALLAEAYPDRGFGAATGDQLPVDGGGIYASPDRLCGTA